MGMMKGNVAMMVSQSLIMGWINAFFSGFVISTHQSAPIQIFRGGWGLWNPTCVFRGRFVLWKHNLKGCIWLT